MRSPFAGFSYGRPCVAARLVRYLTSPLGDEGGYNARADMESAPTEYALSEIQAVEHKPVRSPYLPLGGGGTAAAVTKGVGIGGTGTQASMTAGGHAGPPLRHSVLGGAD